MKRLSRRSIRVRLILVSLALVLIVVRLMLPFVLKAYVNNALKRIADYSGSVGGIRINFLRGAYTIYNVQIVKTNAHIPVPFVTIPEMDLSVEGTALLRGKVVGKVFLLNPSVNFVNGPQKQDQQLGVNRSWRDTLDALYPFTINRFAIQNGVIRFADPQRSPPVDIYVTNLVALATNLTNIEGKSDTLPAALQAEGVTTGEGHLKMDLRMNPLAESPTFKLVASLTGVDLTALNDFLKAYVNVDAEKGEFWVYLNVAAANGGYKGMLKPFMLDAAMLSPGELRKQNILQSFWEGLVGAVSELFTNHSKQQLATVIPISGTIEKSAQVDIWGTIGGILRNAFLQALAPGVPRPVTLPNGPAPPAPR